MIPKSKYKQRYGPSRFRDTLPSLPTDVTIDEALDHGLRQMAPDAARRDHFPWTLLPLDLDVEDVFLSRSQVFAELFPGTDLKYDKSIHAIRPAIPEVCAERALATRCDHVKYALLCRLGYMYGFIERWDRDEFAGDPREALNDMGWLRPESFIVAEERTKKIMTEARKGRSHGVRMKSVDIMAFEEFPLADPVPSAQQLRYPQLGW
ncbi:hypothetical protein OQA88_6818 [Cercophora sp. LCS_1]